MSYCPPCAPAGIDLIAESHGEIHPVGGAGWGTCMCVCVYGGGGGGGGGGWVCVCVGVLAAF